MLQLTECFTAEKNLQELRGGCSLLVFFSMLSFLHACWVDLFGWKEAVQLCKKKDARMKSSSLTVTNVATWRIIRKLSTVKSGN